MITCPKCQLQLRVHPEWSGKQIRCGQCRYVLTVNDTGTLSSAQPNFKSATQNSESDSRQQTISYSYAPGEEALSFVQPPQNPDELGRLGNYRLLKVLGQGGMGMVFQAEDIALQRMVALKVIRPDKSGRDARKRFLREARATAKIEHEHVIPIYHTDEIDGVPFIAMKLLDGQSLEDRLKEQKGPLPIAETLRIGREMAEGLAAAHAGGLIHRDIKPNNVWLEGEAGKVRLLDFGLARSAENDVHLTQTGAILGTPAYMSPEQARSEEANERSDLFSLGCVLYRMCTGHRPFHGDNMLSLLKSVAETAHRPVHELSADVPGPLVAMIDRLLAKQQEDRPESAAEVSETLQEISDGFSLSNPADRSVIQQSAKLSGRTLIYTLSGVSLLLLIGAGWLVLQSFLSPPQTTDTTTPSENMGQETLKEITNSVGMKLVKVPRGKFLMSENGINAQKGVIIPYDYYIGVHEVTQKQWNSLMGNNPSYFSSSNPDPEVVKGIPKKSPDFFPVEQVSWEDTQEFFAKLNDREKGSGWVYRLPTEAEWEFACRCRASGKKECSFDFYLAKVSTFLTEKQANYRDTKLGRTQKVGSYKPNLLGIHDMHGNVWEWCDDWHEENKSRVCRGGSWNSGSSVCRAGYSNGLPPNQRGNDLGFRVVRVPMSK